MSFVDCETIVAGDQTAQGRRILSLQFSTISGIVAGKRENPQRGPIGQQLPREGRLSGLAWAIQQNDFPATIQLGPMA